MIQLFDLSSLKILLERVIKSFFSFRLIKRYWNINAIASIKLGIQGVSETGSQINIYI